MTGLHRRGRPVKYGKSRKIVRLSDFHRKEEIVAKDYWENPPEVEEDYIPQESIVDEKADFLYSVALSTGEESPPEEPEGFWE